MTGQVFTTVLNKINIKILFKMYNIFMYFQNICKFGNLFNSLLIFKIIDFKAGKKVK